MSGTSSSHIAGSHNTTTSGNTTTTNSNNTTGRSRTYERCKHNEYKGSTINNYHGDSSQAKIKRQLRHNEILRSIEAQAEKSTFLGLLPLAKPDAHISPINPDDPKLYWIFRNEDFIRWKSEDYSQVLLLCGGPPGCRMTDISSHIANQEKNGTVFYFCCNSASITTFAHSVLRHILKVSDDPQAKSITTTFLSSRLHKILEQGPLHFHDGDLSTIMTKILYAGGGDLLEALTKAFDQIKMINETSIIIDGIDKLGEEGAQFLEKMSSPATFSPKFKVLLTCQPGPHTENLVANVPCIEYDKERQECLNSLRHHGTRYDKISVEHDGTLTWLWEHKQYKAWSSAHYSDLLLIEGKPGSGKSTLTKYFMRNLSEREPLANQAIVASFFYSYRDRKLHTNHANMLRSILYDVLHENENFFFHFQSLYRKTLLRGTWPYDSLKNILLSFKKHPTEERLYLIIDAMDESDDKDRRDIITLLRQLCGNEHSTCVVKIFVASRPITGLNHNVAEVEHIIKMQDENGPDILKFAESFLGKLKLSTTFHKKTKDYIIQYAQGVFVWVYLVQNELLLNYHEIGYRNQDIYDFLRSLPTELDEFYERMFRKLEQNKKQQDIQDGVRMFQLVLFSFRPLRAEEIQQALAIPDSTSIEYAPSDEPFENGLIQEFPKRIIHCGGNFLEIKGNGIIQFMHQTVHTFFSRSEGLVAKSLKFNMSEEDARRRISITCFRYLMLCMARSAPDDEPSNTKCWEPAHFEKYAEHLNRRPLIDYALSHFQQHQNDCALRLQKRKNACSQCVNDERLIVQLSEQLSNNPASLLFESWIHSYLGRGIAGKEKGQSLQGFRKNMQHTAKSAHVRFKSWIDSCRGQGVAAKEKMPFSKDFRNNMLHTATRMQYSQVVESLLTAGADREACLLDKTPLIISAEAGDVATAGVLLRRKACTDAQDNFEQTALLLAAMKGYDTIVSLLINSGAKKDATDQYGQTALHLATSKGYNSIVQLLVENLGVDMEVKDNAGSTSLHVAAIWNQGSTVRLLLTFGANIEAEDNRKRTALHWAAIYGSKEIIKLLLNDFGANSEAENWQKRTALHCATLYRHESTVQLLVNTFHVNLEAKDVYGRTPRDLSRER